MTDESKSHISWFTDILKLRAELAEALDRINILEQEVRDWRSCIKFNADTNTYGGWIKSGLDKCFAIYIEGKKL
jgi:hypothetical protein